MKNKLKIHFSSQKSDWETPDDLFNRLNREFHFTIDVCATKNNAKLPRYITPTANFLDCIFTKRNRCFMNPPYGREISKFIKHAYEQSKYGTLFVCLLPSRTDTKWFHEYCLKGEIRFLKGRLKFKGAKNSAPFPSMIVIFKTLKGKKK